MHCDRDRCLRIALVLVLSFCGYGCRRDAPQTYRVELRDFAVWTQVNGSLEAVESRALYSTVSQPTTILYLAPEGTRIKPGEVVVELDRSPLDLQLASLEKDRSLAEAELRVLQEAELPLELDDLRQEIEKAAYEANQQKAVVDRTASLFEEDLVSASEWASQQVRLERMEAATSALTNRLALLEQIVHPARLQKAQAQLEAARRQLELVEEQAAQTTLTSPIEGMVAHLPMHMDGAYRTVREGDTILRNQKFVMIADMDTLIAVCAVPESQVGGIVPGAAAVITPTALPEVQIDGTVASVGELAVSLPGRAPWPKVVTVTITLKSTDPRLKSGASVYAQVLTHHQPQALVLPRAGVRWDEGKPWCEVRRNGSPVRVDLTLGAGNERDFVVLDGIEAGDEVILPDMQ